MERLERSYEQASSYPRNLVDSPVPPVYRDSLLQEIRSQSSKLFCRRESDATVDFLVRAAGRKELDLKRVHDEDMLHKALWAPLFQHSSQNSLTMIFLTAPNSRDRLNVTQEMAQKVFSYMQTMPEFLDCVMPFGIRDYSVDCLITFFKCNNRLSAISRDLQVPSLGRSGRQLEHCYALRSVESTPQPDWPWSIRLCSIWHSLDLEIGSSNWIVLKANRLIQRLVRDADEAGSLQSELTGSEVARAVAEALRVHGLIATWCGSNWARYVGFLEDALQKLTRPTLAVTLETEKLLTNDFKVGEEVPGISSTPSGMSRMFSGRSSTFGKACSSLRSFPTRISTFGKKADSDKDSYPLEQISVTRHAFSFEDLPRVHFLGEKANETLDVLNNNEGVLEDLLSDYRQIFFALTELQEDSGSKAALARFEDLVSLVQKDMRRQLTRLEQLLKLLESRKLLLGGILQFESAQTSRIIAEKAGISAQNMEVIAQETKLETVSMRVITLVTLFFLPGTFISTLMSTPIVTFADGSPTISEGSISPGALGFFAAVSIPLMVFTVAVWWIVYWLENRKERRRRQSESNTPCEV